MEGLTAARYQLEGAEKDLLEVTNSMSYLADTLENMPFACVTNNEEFKSTEEKVCFYENTFENAASVLHVLMDKLGKAGDRLVKVKNSLEASQDD